MRYTRPWSEIHPHILGGDCTGPHKKLTSKVRLADCEKWIRDRPKMMRKDHGDFQGRRGDSQAKMMTMDVEENGEC